MKKTTLSPSNSNKSVEYVLGRFKKHKKDNFNDLRNFISFFKNKDNIKNATNLVIKHTKNLIIRAGKLDLDLINFMGSTKNIDLFLSMLQKQNNDINVTKEIENILYIRHIIKEKEKEKEKSDKLKADLRYGHYQIKNNLQNVWDKLPTCKTPQWDSVVEDFKECTINNFDDLKKFVASYKEEKDRNEATNLVIDYTKNIIINDIKEILNAKQDKDFIIAQKANEIANFMGSNENINLFLDYLPEQPNDNIKFIMEYAKRIITQEEQRNSSITGSLSSWSIPSSSESNYSGSNVATANSSAISFNSDDFVCSTPNSKKKLPPIINPNNSNNLPKR